MPVEVLAKANPQLIEGVLLSTVIEREFGQERFMIENAMSAVRRGVFNRVPVIIGIVSAENANVGPSKLTQLFR